MFTASVYAFSLVKQAWVFVRREFLTKLIKKDCYWVVIRGEEIDGMLALGSPCYADKSGDHNLCYEGISK